MDRSFTHLSEPFSPLCLSPSLHVEGIRSCCVNSTKPEDGSSFGAFYLQPVRVSDVLLLLLAAMQQSETVFSGS